MPKVSFAQEMAEMERVVGAARVHAAILPPLAQSVADQLEALIAQAKAVKAQQQSYLAAQMETTERFLATVDHGNWLARRVRARVVLALGTKHAQLAQFGIRIRRRPRRKTAQAPAAVAGCPESVRPARADAQNAGATIVEIGGNERSGGGNAPSRRAEAPERGAGASRRRGDVAPKGEAVPSERGDAASHWAAVPSAGGIVATAGAAASRTTRRYRAHASRPTGSRRRE